MKTIKLATIVYTMALAILATLILFGCSKDVDTVLPGNQSMNDENMKVLMHQEKARLLHLVELQKFHSDVYSILFESYQKSTFRELSDRDSQYQKLLMHKVCDYGVENPMIGLPTGHYADRDIREMYLDFVNHYSNDLLQALLYTNQMEKDILVDINNSIELTSHSDIISVYNSLISETKSQIKILEEKIDKYESVEAEANLIRDH